MSNSESPDHFFSALEILSSAAATVNSGDLQSYADESILISTLPETPSSSCSTSLQTLDQTSIRAKNRRCSVLRRRAKGVRIRSSDSDEETIGNPSFAPGDSGKIRVGLIDVVRKMSAGEIGRFEDRDILEIAAMKGICFDPPRFWKGELRHGNGVG